MSWFEMCAPVRVGAPLEQGHQVQVLGQLGGAEQGLQAYHLLTKGMFVL